MAILKCEICGGNLIYSLNSEYIICENCNNKSVADIQELSRIRRIYRDAEHRAKTNSVNECLTAINQLESISFVSEAKDKLEKCEKHLKELKSDELRQTETEIITDKNNEKIGVIIIILFVVAFALAITGAIYIIHHIGLGDLSPTATIITFSILLLLFISVIINKFKS